MTTSSISNEDYVGAIFRLQNAGAEYLPLGVLQEFFGFSPISIHEMVQKLASRGLVEYQPYRGVKLTQTGADVAQSLVRRHRIWEVFLSDELEIPIDEAHQLAGDLEHAAPDWITERLFNYLGEPDFCPHGSTIGDSVAPAAEICLEDSNIGVWLKVTKIYPEKESVLSTARNIGLRPGRKIKVVDKNTDGMKVILDGKEETLTGETRNCIWCVDAKNDE